jgi:uncharacterized protein
MPIKLKSSPTGYLTKKARGGTVTHTGYRGVFARSRIFEGELIAVWGGEVMPSASVYMMPPELRRLALQVDEELYIVSGRKGPADWINHCCEPNAGMSGQISLVALRDIAPGEEVCFDYAMTDGSPYDEFECRCGAASCRTRVTGDDWRRIELQLSYGDYFSPYLRRRIQKSSPALQEVGAAVQLPSMSGLPADSRRKTRGAQRSPRLKTGPA